MSNRENEPGSRPTLAFLDTDRKRLMEQALGRIGQSARELCLQEQRAEKAVLLRGLRGIYRDLIIMEEANTGEGDMYVLLDDAEGACPRSPDDYLSEDRTCFDLSRFLFDSRLILSLCLRETCRPSLAGEDLEARLRDLEQRLSRAGEILSCGRAIAVRPDAHHHRRSPGLHPDDYAAREDDPPGGTGPAR